MNSIFSTLTLNMLFAEFSPIANQWDNMQPCRNPFARLYLITQGEGWVWIDAKKVHLVPGNVYLIPSDSLCRFKASDEFTKYWVHFSTELATGVSLFDFSDQGRV